MKKALLQVFLFSFVIIGCTGKSPFEVPSTGRINSLSIIISDNLWNAEVGDSIRRKFAAPVDGLPQEEPLFSIEQDHPQSFSSNRESRNILIVKKEDTSGIRIVRNEFANPQLAIHISGRDNHEILSLLEKN